MKNYFVLMDRKTDIFKILLLSNLVYGFNRIPIKIPASYFVDNKKMTHIKFI